MAHPSHKLKAYCGDAHKPLIFCSECGLEETEISIHIKCPCTFYVDTRIDKPYPEFVSGLPDRF